MHSFLNFFAPLHPWQTRRLSPRAFAPWLLAVGLTVGAQAVTWAQDAPYHEVQRLMQAGQPDQARQVAEGYLSKFPADPQMRFLRGVLQSRQNDAAGARQTFEDLVRDYPELPEPHNNLAVLDAQQLRYAEALSALQMAVRLNPEYATAHLNLGDVYAKLAAQAYQRAQQLHPDDPAPAQRANALTPLLKLVSPPSP